MLDQSVGQGELLGAVLAPEHLLVELLHVHPVHSVALERQVTSEQSCYVVVYHVTIVAIGHGMLKKFWPLVLGCVLRTAGSSII